MSSASARWREPSLVPAPSVTMVATAMLLRLRDTPGGRARRRDRRPLGWQIVSDLYQVPFMWFPPRAGDELLAAGLLGDDGKATRAGITASQAWR